MAPEATSSVPAVPGCRLSQLLYVGRSAAVWRGRDDEDRPVVVKLHTDPMPTERELAARRRAFELGKELGSDRVVHHLALLPHAGGLALVTEDFGGHSLDHRLREGPIELEEALSIAIRIAEGLQELEGRGVVHKDLKPANVVQNESTGELKLIDLGSASRLASEATGGAEYLSGTLLYIAPEQTGRMNRAVDGRSDLYSFGVTLYELLSGRPPFLDNDARALIHAHLARDPRPLRELAPTVPASVAALVHRLLRKDPADRYQSTAGVLWDLQRCLEAQRTGATEAFILGARDVSSRFRLPDTLYGRKEERETLLAAFQTAVNGGVAALTVMGPPGIGKSALVSEVRRPIAERAGWFAVGKFDQFRHDLPYQGWIGVGQALVRQLLTEPEGRLRPLQEALVEALGPNRSLLTEVMPQLESLLGRSPPPDAVGPSEAQARFNQAFRTFVRLVASEEHPLVVFLDDLQWADLPSLRLLEVLLTDRALGHLLILGAYRDGEVGGTHPLRRLLEGLSERAQRVDELNLGPLNEGDISALLRDTLGASTETVAPLASLVFRQTRGNPFFVRQFLDRLHQKSLLTFEPGAGWRWDPTKIEAEDITDNVAELMSTRLSELAEPTRNLLELASCIGSSFDLASLATIQGWPRHEIGKALDQALSEGLILPLDDDYKYVAHAETEQSDLNPRYRFLHDRVQQAAHGAIDPETRARLHLTIGRRLWETTAPEDLEDRCVQIVDHLGLALDQIPETWRVDAAKLFLAAGRRAKASMATAAAERYLRNGLELSRGGTRELDLALHVESADVAYIEERFDDVGPHADAALAAATSPLERVPIHNIRIGMGVSRNDYVTATHLAVDVLRDDLGVRLPQDPSAPQVLLGLAKTRFRLRNHSHEGLLALPEMTDPTVLAAMHLLMKTATNSYWGVPNLVPLIAFKMIELSLRHGNTGMSAYGHALYGMVQSAALGDVERGYASGQLAMDLLERTGATHILGKTGLLFQGYIRPALEPMRECSLELLGHYHDALAAGDVENAAYCATVAYSADLMAGEPLVEMSRRHAPFVEAVFESGQEQSIYALQVWVQAVENLQAADQRSELTGEHIDFPARLAHLERDGLDMAIAQGVCAAGWLALLLGARGQAMDAWEKLAVREDKAPGAIFLKPCMANYTVLLERKSGDEGLSLKERLRLAVLRYRLEVWAEQNPHDFGPYAALLQAETAVNDGREADAEAAFSLALDRAQESKNLWLEALIAERAGSWNGGRERHRLARRLLETAAVAWRRFGLAKGHNTVTASIEQTVGTLEDLALSQLDMDAILEAVRVVSSEIEVDALAAKVIQIAVVIAGARRGVLLLEEEGQRVPNARAEISPEGELEIWGGQETGAVEIPASVVDYVARTRKALVVDDAREHAIFSRDPVLAKQGARSVLAVPLMMQGRLLGVLVLENERGTGVFTNVHAELVEAIAGQAAVSLENARLFEREREQAEVFSRFVPRPFLENLGYRRIEDARLGDGIGRKMSILFSDLRGFTAISEQMTPEENFAFINHYLARMTPAIEDNGGFVDAFVGDAVMALFVADSDGAVAAGVGMHRALQRYNSERANRGRTPLAMGIGIHTGDVLLGIIGSPTRMQANVKGDAVNTASRLEGLTKHYGAPMLISDQTRASMRDPTALSMRPGGLVQVKGRTEPVTVWEVLDAQLPERRDQLVGTTSLFAAALAAYLERDFAGAAHGFSQCLAAVPDDAMAGRFHRLAVDLLQKGVSGDWSGVDVRTVK